MPDIGSTQARWSLTPFTPGAFSAATMMAARCRSSVIAPHSSTTPSLTMTLMSAVGAHG